MNHWLIKSEPDEFSFEDLWRSPGRKTHWDGVRNYQARNFMRDDMRIGDRVFYYHSNCEVPAIVGLGAACAIAARDLTREAARQHALGGAEGAVGRDHVPAPVVQNAGEKLQRQRIIVDHEHTARRLDHTKLTPLRISLLGPPGPA